MERSIFFIIRQALFTNYRLLITNYTCSSSGFSIIGTSIPGAVPLIRQFGELLLVRAEQPVRAPIEGQNRIGSRWIVTLFRWYTQRLGKKAIWGTDETVGEPSADLSAVQYQQERPVV